MNRVFKTKWSVAHQEYIVTDEKHTTKGKAAKSAVALAVTALMLGAGVASAAYMAPNGVNQDPGFVAQNNAQVNAATKSWETDEYNKNWGLQAMNASSAYALGYHGQGVKVGMMDSGILVTHKELSGDRWHTVSASGQYTHDGERYPQYAYGSDAKDTGKYNKGDKFEVNGAFDPSINDNHGTGCAGVYAGNRDGSGMHGVAWGSDFYSANTGGTDDTNYGPFPDYGFFKAGYDALVNSGVKIINNSFGTNLKQVNEKGEIVDYYHSGPELTSVNDIEYEYYLFKKQYNGGPSFVDAAWDAVKGKDVIQVFTNGNNDRANPYHRALYPYFNPEAEAQWIAIAGLKQVDQNSDPDNYQLEGNFNEAGYAKYWTLVGPGQNGYTSNIAGDDKYGGYNGTSMAAPFVSGAFAVLASRYQDMSAVQVREVLLTTANHKNADGTNMEGWDNVDKSTPVEGEVSDRMGWGVPDLKKGMYGLGQLTGKFDYNLKSGHLDVWSNDISQVALDQREREDIKWLKSVTEDGTLDGKIVVSNNPDDYKLTNTSSGSANKDGKEHNYDLAGIKDKEIKLEDAMKWRLEYYEKRAAAIRDKIKNGLYDGSLVKRGEGTLVMTGSNTYRGGTTVEAGKLLGYSNSFGVSGDDGKANGKVTVNGGTFGILETYNDQFTMKGDIKPGAGKHSVDVTVNKGGTFQITAGQSVTMGNLEFKDGAGFTVGSEDVDVLKEAYAGKDQTGTVTVDKVTGADLAVANPDYAFFKTELNVDGNKLTGTLSRDKNASFATYAQNANGHAIAGALEAAGNGALYDTLIGASKGDVTKTYNSLGDDFVLNTRNAGIANGMLLARAVKDQAAGIGEGRAVEMGEGTARLWATGIGSKSTVDYGMSDMDSDFYAGLVGAEVDVADSTKVGVFFGAGSTENKAASQKAKSDDIHVGAYGVTNVNDFAASYGFVYSHLDADVTRSLQVGSQLGMNAFSGKTDLTQIFGEVAYKGLNTTGYSFEPYFGLSWIHAESDAFNEQVGNMKFATTPADQDVQVTTVGIRGALPFTVGSAQMAVKGDLAWNHFFGDTEAEAAMNLGGSAVANLKGGELGDMASVGLGLEAKVGKMTTMGVSYTGAYDGDITSHGISANVRFNF